MELVVSGCAGIVVDKIARQHSVDDYCEFAGSGGKGFGLANAGRQPAIEGTERSRVLEATCAFACAAAR